MKRLNKGFGGMVFYAAVLLCILTLFCAGFVGASAEEAEVRTADIDVSRRDGPALRAG